MSNIKVGVGAQVTFLNAVSTSGGKLPQTFKDYFEPNPVVRGSTPYLFAPGTFPITDDLDLIVDKIEIVPNGMGTTGTDVYGNYVITWRVQPRGAQKPAAPASPFTPQPPVYVIGNNLRFATVDLDYYLFNKATYPNPDKNIILVQTARHTFFPDNPGITKDLGDLTSGITLADMYPGYGNCMLRVKAADGQGVFIDLKSDFDKYKPQLGGEAPTLAKGCASATEASGGDITFGTLTFAHVEAAVNAENNQILECKGDVYFPLTTGNNNGDVKILCTDAYGRSPYQLELTGFSLTSGFISDVYTFKLQLASKPV
jgi:hypothetical protein